MMKMMIDLPFGRRATDGTRTHTLIDRIEF